MSKDFFLSKEEAINHKETTRTNDRYKNFFQDIFHAGDEEQFQFFRDAKNRDVCNEHKTPQDNLFVDRPCIVWDKYLNLHADATINTFRYIFNKFKKGIFVKIENNKLKVFLPFSKANFRNEWSHKIQVDPKFPTLNHFFRFIAEMEGFYSFKEGSVNQNIDEWYANNCLVRSEYPLQEGDSNVGNVRNMLEELCAQRTVPDIEFFINRRDFPILTRDGTEAYNHIWGTKDLPLVSHAYEQYLPIFSMSNSDRYADILSPTWDDWARIQSASGKYFPGSQQDYSGNFSTKWADKKPTAVFRGASTGCGVDEDTNPRLKLAGMSTIKHADDEGIPYLDACITKWNLRPRKLEGEKYLRTINIKDLKSKGIDIYKRDSAGNYIIDTKRTYYSRDARGKYIIDNKSGKYIRIGDTEKYVYDKHLRKIPNFLTPKEQSEYKYIVNVDGHVSAFRLSLELSMGSVILLVNSSWKIWYSNLLIPFVHYVPVLEDLSDLIDKIKWCRNNDKKCEEIAKNAKDFFMLYLQKDGVLDYMQKTLSDLKSEMGVYLYNSKSPLDTVISEEYKSLDFTFPKIIARLSDLNVVPKTLDRSYGLLQGMEFVIRKIIIEGNFEEKTVGTVKIFKNILGSVSRTMLAGFALTIKTTTNKQKIKEHIHEAYIGTKVLNQLSKLIPNFGYIFGLYHDTISYNVVGEFITGETLYDYIAGVNFSFQEFLFIIMQLCMALEVAQASCGFVHYDLTPWNIILQRTDKPKIFDYILSNKRVIRVRTKCIPVIIDFGKSHVIHDGIHHGFINMFKVSTVQDMFTIIITSVDQIINSKYYLEENDRKNLLHLCNFLTNTKYRPDKFEDIESLAKFTKYARKYSALISDDKDDLEKFRPYDLLRYIMKMDYKFSGISTVTEYIPTMDKGNGRQVFEYVFSKEINQQLETYVNVFKRLKLCTLPQPKNLFFMYYVVQSLENNLRSVCDEMILFLNYYKINKEPYEKIFEETMSFIESVYDKKIKMTKEKDVEYPYTNAKSTNIIQAPYAEETFLIPQKILALLDESSDINDLSEYKEIIEMILLNKGKYKLADNHREYYLSNFDNLLRSSSLSMKNNSANRKTLLLLAQAIYKEDEQKIQLEFSSLTSPPCDSVKEYLKLYKKIIQKCE